MGRRAEGLRPAWGSPGRSSPWQAALLAASILSSGFLLTQAQDIEVTVKPSQTLLQGQDATLTPGGTADFILCNWYRGAQAEASRILTYAPSLSNQQNGPGFTGRETAGPGCSLRIQSVTLSDSGTYTVSKALKNLSLETGRVQIEVIEKLFPPTLWPTESTVKEHANVTLNCTISASSTVTVSWFKDGKPVPAKAVISEQNRILLVPDIGKEDEGTYTCVASSRANDTTSNPSRIILESGPPSSLGVGAILGIVLGSLAVATLAGTLLFYFLRARSPKDTSSKQMNPTSPVYENTCPSAQTQVVPENSSDVNHTYEELQHGRQSVYDQLKW